MVAVAATLAGTDPKAVSMVVVARSDGGAAAARMEGSCGERPDKAKAAVVSWPATDRQTHERVSHQIGRAVPTGAGSFF